MSSIFVSYRRGDTSGYAGRLSSDLAERFGRDVVFRDVNAIELGSDFAEAISRAIAQCRVLLVVIGRDWLTVVDAEGNLRLADPDDVLRREIEAGLDQGKLVIPVVVAGARMPYEHELPASLAALARRQAIELSDGRWEYDIERLVAHLRQVAGLHPPGGPTTTPRLAFTDPAASPTTSALASPAETIAAIVLALVVLVGATLLALARNAQSTVQVIVGAAVVGCAVVFIRSGHQRRHAADVPLVELPLRAELITRIWNQRIRNGLERSLHQGVHMQLGLISAPELLKPSYHQLGADSGERVDLLTAYAESSGQLVIVGEPGSGKTTQLLFLMRHLLEVARRDPLAPVPELFPLAGWHLSRKPLLDWLAQQLQLRHGYPHSVARSAISHHKVIPMLDGLDEVKADERAACVAAINAFWRTQRGGPVVLCSRVQEYEDLPERLPFGGAVRVHPPSHAEIASYLRSFGPNWHPVATAIETGEDPALGKLLATPLLLSVAVLAYREADPAQLCHAPMLGTRRQALWQRYVEEMQHRPSEVLGAEVASRYEREDVRRWLTWLARSMRQTGLPEFWLHDAVGSRRFRFVVRLALGTLVAALSTAVLALTAVPGASFAESLVAGMIFGIAAAVFTTVRPAYRAPFRPATVLRGMATGIGGGVVAGMLLMSALALAESHISPTTPFPSNAELLRASLAVGIVLGCAFGPALAFIAIGPDRTRRAPLSPTQILGDSALIGTIGGTGVGVVIVLALTVLAGTGALEAFGVGVSTTLVASLILGLGAVMFHLGYRLLLWSRGNAPFRLVLFLIWACEHLYLHSNGAAYTWIHLDFRDYLAEASFLRNAVSNPAPPAAAA